MVLANNSRKHAKMYLSRALWLNEQVRAKTEELEHMRELMDSVSNKAVIGGARGSHGDPVARLAAKLTDLSDSIIEDAKNITVIYAEIAALIDALPDASCRILLSLHYLTGKTMQDIATHLGYSERQVYRIHNRALDLVDCALNDKQ